MLTFLLLNLSLGRVAGADSYSRDDFPVDFVFGSGTSAYQVPTHFLSIYSSHASFPSIILSYYTHHNSLI